MYTELKIRMWFLNQFPQTHSTGTDDTRDNVSHPRKVSQYDCREMQENRMYSFNNPSANVLVYQRSYRTEVTATLCRIKVMPLRLNCGMHWH